MIEAALDRLDANRAQDSRPVNAAVTADSFTSVLGTLDTVCCPGCSTRRVGPDRCSQSRKLQLLRISRMRRSAVEALFREEAWQFGGQPAEAANEA